MSRMTNYKLSVFFHGAFSRPRYSRDPLKLAAEAEYQMNRTKRLGGVTPDYAIVQVHVKRLSGRASQWRTIFMALPHHKTTCHYVI